MNAAGQDELRVEYQYRGRELRAVLSGARAQLEELISAWHGIAAEVRRVGAERLLIRMQVEGPPLSLGEVRVFLENIGGLGLESLPTAVVGDVGYRDWMGEGVEIIAAEFGFHARVFEHLREAEVWLLHRGSEDLHRSLDE